MFYLGGNGFYWKAVFHKQAPWAMEVRRAESGVRVWATDVGESYHAFDGSYAASGGASGDPHTSLWAMVFQVRELVMATHIS